VNCSVFRLLSQHFAGLPPKNYFWESANVFSPLPRLFSYLLFYSSIPITHKVLLIGYWVYAKPRETQKNILKKKEKEKEKEDRLSFIKERKKIKKI